MKNIENTYISYDDLIEEVGEKVIQSRINHFNQEMHDFLVVNELEEVAFVDSP